MVDPIDFTFIHGAGKVAGIIEGNIKLIQVEAKHQDEINKLTRRLTESYQQTANAHNGWHKALLRIKELEALLDKKNHN